jgi:hypothetical protein
MALTTIDEVISAMDGIIQRAWDEKSRTGYFAALYRRVTRAVRDGVSRGRFQNGPLMEQLDVVFASRYLDALALAQLPRCSADFRGLRNKSCLSSTRVVDKCKIVTNSSRVYTCNKWTICYI